MRHQRRTCRTTVALLVVFALTGCSLGGEVLTPIRHHSEAKASDLLNELLHRAQLTVDASGGGEWKWGDQSSWNGPNDKSGFIGEPCGAGADSQQYTIGLIGPPQPDPAAALEKVADAWEKQGWTVRTVVPAKPRDPHFIGEIAVDYPEGGGLGYQASNESSGITAESACTNDPAMNDRTK